MKNESAFPFFGDYGRINNEGLTKLEYFAAMAMHGFVSRGWTDREATVSSAYNVAEAMLKESEKRNK